MVATVAELFPVESVTLYKAIDGEDYEEVEMALQLDVEEEGRRYSWDKQSEIIKTPESLKEYFSETKPLEPSNANEAGECYIPISNQSKTVAILHIKSSTLEPPQILTLHGLIRIYENNLVILHENERDKLTSLFNRRTFEQRFGNLLSTQKNIQKMAVSEFGPGNKRFLLKTNQVHLAMIDIDHFKKVNDNYGHVYGDEILILIANLMKSSFRSTDHLFRFGGEEFVILLEPTSSEMAYRVLERFRQAVEQHKFPQVDKVTVSIGFTLVKEGTLYTTAMGRADQALYHAKHNGRNCTHSFEKLIDTGQLFPARKIGPIEMFRS